VNIELLLRIVVKDRERPEYIVGVICMVVLYFVKNDFKNFGKSDLRNIIPLVNRFKI